MNLDPITQQLGVGGVFGLGLGWLLLKFKPWQGNSHLNGNGKREMEYGRLTQKVESLEETTRGLVVVVSKLTTDVAVMGNSVQSLTIEVARRIGT